LGIIILEDELVSASQSSSADSSLYQLKASSELVVLIIRNSIFINNYNRLINADHVTVYISGCIFSDNVFEDSFPANHTLNLNLSSIMNNLTYSIEALKQSSNSNNQEHERETAIEKIMNKENNTTKDANGT